MEIFPLSNDPNSLMTVSADLAPATPDESNKRAYFFCQAMIDRCAKAARDVANSLGRLSTRSAKRATIQLSSAIKQLACIATYLSLLDQKAVNNQQWFLDFQILTFQHMDELIAMPTARGIVERYGSFTEKAIIAETINEVSTILGAEKEGAQILLESVIQSLRTYGNTMVLVALREDVEELGRLMAAMAGGTDDEDEGEEDLDEDADDGELDADDGELDADEGREELSQSGAPGRQKQNQSAEEGDLIIDFDSLDLGSATNPSERTEDTT